MANHSFDEFINQQSKASKKVEIDWQAKLDEWKQYVSAFHNKIKNFLNPYIESGKIKLTERKIKLREEYIGSYEVNALDILLGYQHHPYPHRNKFDWSKGESGYDRSKRNSEICSRTQRFERPKD